MKKHGFAGSTGIPKLVFLSTITRMFKRPVSAVIKGPSSSGKSFALRAGLRYVPKSAYEEFNGLSEKALVYNKLNLQHRFIVIQEAAGLADGDGRTFLRQLLTEDQIRYMTVQHTKADGHVGHELPVVKGPVGLLMTTTANSLHWEDETRLLSLHVDQSPEQIKRVLMVNGGEGPTIPSDEILSRWHALHEYVCSGPQDVAIPYTKALAERMPTSHGRIARDFTKVLALIRAHALLHQRTRERIHGKVVATLLDYYQVHGLVSEPLSHGLQLSVPAHIREIVEAVRAQWNAEPNIGLSTTDLASRLGRDPGVVSRNAKAAIQLGYLENLNPGQGRKASLMPGDRELPRGAALPDPRELVDIIDEEKHVTRMKQSGPTPF